MEKKKQRGKKITREDKFIKKPEEAFVAARKVCEKHGLDAEEILGLGREDCSPLEYVDMLIIEARQKARLVSAVFTNDDLIDEMGEGMRYPELMAVKEQIEEKKKKIVELRSGSNT